MAKTLLNDTTLRNAKPEAKDKRLNDGGGLYRFQSFVTCGAESAKPEFQGR